MLWKSSISTLPPFIFQMIDHIYISDHRGIYFASSFPLLINTSFLKESGLVTKESKPNQSLFSIKKDNNGQNEAYNNTLLSNEIAKAAQSKQKILLYSDDYSASCSLFINYVMVHYHFTKMDIQHMIISRPMDSVLLQSMKTELNNY